MKDSARPVQPRRRQKDAANVVIGIVAGWLAEKVMGRNHGLITNLIVGVVGALIGGFIAQNLLGIPVGGFNLITLLVAFGGGLTWSSALITL